MFPLPAILIANLAISIQKLKFGRVLSWIIIVIIAAINFWGIPFRYEPNRQLNQMRSIANFVISKTNGKPFNFALISGGNSDYAYRYFFTLWNHPSTTIEYPGADPKRKTVTNQLFVVCESLPCQPLGNSLWEIAGFGQADISEHWNISVVEIYKLIHHKDK
jgi:hypothetical protein